ncbi:hypothetical protein CVV68_01455 [Arthrobacter livingstonensis]|uniref:Uncharacterized protein n=1 Tax=Arthrobacter livingstonensis TaxID=670078 RepID=A0A2V5LDJ2_9MICC|nr:hypothetical protein [Arthrobacter livingstonensis]PYI69801.1 hypothetical protein CVV68_01455 [Arthrobacter livingstonensis]
MSPVLFTGVALLAGINQWLGIGLAIIAAFSASPQGTSMMARSLSRGLGRSVKRLREILARFLPFLRRSVTVHAAVARATLNASGTLGSHAESWVPTATVEEKIEALRQLLSETRDQLRKLDERLDAEATRLRSDIATSEQRILEKLDDLRAQIARQNKDAAAIDARSLPVIAVGILLTGAPEDLARCQFPINWLLTLGATAFSVWLLCSIWLSYRRAPSRPQAS